MKRGRQTRNQLLAQPVDKQLGHLMRPRTQLEHGNACAEGIDGHPEPEDLRVAAQARAQFIQLQMWEHSVAEGALMQRLGMGSRPRQPACDRGMPDAKDPFCR